MRVLPPEVVLEHVGQLSRGKLKGIEVILDAIEADESLTLMTVTNRAVAGGDGAKRFAEHLRERAGRPQAIREGVPLAGGRAQRFASKEEIKAFVERRRLFEARFAPAPKEP